MHVTTASPTEENIEPIRAAKDFCGMAYREFEWHEADTRVSASCTCKPQRGLS